jgi:hypothetical protein
METESDVEMQLSDAISTAEGFVDWSHAEKIKFFAWFLHTHRNQTHFTPAQITDCFDELNLSPPSVVGPFLAAMEKRKPKEALRDASGYRLENRLREQFDLRFGHRAATVQVHRMLSELPSKVSNPVEKTYLEESLICFRHRAFRAAIVMCWNLAFDHLCEFLLAKHLAAFNKQLPVSFPKAEITCIVAKDDFSRLRESEVLQVCKSANIISGSVHKILKEKLDRRNIAAHPSGVIISEATAEEFIKDLVENVVQKFG